MQPKQYWGAPRITSRSVACCDTRLSIPGLIDWETNGKDQLKRQDLALQHTHLPKTEEFAVCTLLLPFRVVVSLM